MSEFTIPELNGLIAVIRRRKQKEGDGGCPLTKK